MPEYPQCTRRLALVVSSRGRRTVGQEGGRNGTGEPVRGAPAGQRRTKGLDGCARARPVRRRPGCAAGCEAAPGPARRAVAGRGEPHGGAIPHQCVTASGGMARVAWRCNVLQYKEGRDCCNGSCSWRGFLAAADRASAARRQGPRRSGQTGRGCSASLRIGSRVGRRAGLRVVPQSGSARSSVAPTAASE